MENDDDRRLREGIILCGDCQKEFIPDIEFEMECPFCKLKEKQM